MHGRRAPSPSPRAARPPAPQMRMLEPPLLTRHSPFASYLPSLALAAQSAGAAAMAGCASSMATVVPSPPASLRPNRLQHHLPHLAPQLPHPSPEATRRRRALTAVPLGLGHQRTWLGLHTPPRAKPRPPESARDPARAPQPLPPPPASLLGPANDELLRSPFKNRDQGSWLPIRE